MSLSSLPRILYVSDVPVELSFAGPTLLYRLLELYPKDSLLIVQGMELNPSARLSGVRYVIWKSAIIERLRITRLNKWLNVVMVLGQFLKFRAIPKAIESFKPDIILTVSFRLMWVQAFKLSKAMKLPLHLILHDDWLTSEHYGIMQKFLSKEFERMYRSAAGKFCISPNMEKHYHKLFGIEGRVLFPMRGVHDRVFEVRKRELKQSKLRFCYAGTLYSSDYAYMLNKLSGVLAIHNCELHIFSNLDLNALSDYEYLTKPHVKFYDLMGPKELMQKMNEEMDVGIVLNSFAWEEAFKYNFSSKLVDYSSAGLAVLLWGPASSGAISWAIESSYDAVITTDSQDSLHTMVTQLANDEFRESLAERMSKMGQSEFGYQRNYDEFIRGITLLDKR